MHKRKWNITEADIYVIGYPTGEEKRMENKIIIVPEEILKEYQTYISEGSTFCKYE